ncbi:MAG: lysophospholipid acyltransferase family protein [Flexistipes sinusarabici]|uniref:Lysophospholipid acyltransferase family protein n=1 Tax=Flexistipes sinusarabici TaxID=2352 RepID=A0A5D0MQR9_FLESI|nr:lysophospholipid acyltransferase family protein [Flexistipes sinusarabici]TYB34061.1 MAG: lysophospholipid acyltransferase family protein [Flexistipes sinusarabici]
MSFGTKLGLTLLFFIIRIYSWTLRFNAVYLSDEFDNNKKKVFAIWHGHLLPLVLYYKNTQTMTIVSKSKDGDIADFFLKKLGYKTVRGSSSRGGSEALMNAANLMGSGLDAAVTIDGPKGPKFSVKPGVIYLAKKAGGEIIPVVCSVKWYKKFRSWDNFILPAPFSKINIYFGENMQVAEPMDRETIKYETEVLREKMLELTRVYSKDFL